MAEGEKGCWGGVRGKEEAGGECGEEEEEDEAERSMLKKSSKAEGKVNEGWRGVSTCIVATMVDISR